MFGLRAVERARPSACAAPGHRVLTPDLFAGAVAAGHGPAPALEDGFALMERIGWDTIVERARAAYASCPPTRFSAGSRWEWA